MSRPSSTLHSFTLLALLGLLSCARAQISISIGTTQTFGSSCNVQNATLSLPQEGDVEVVPGDIVKYIALATGQQEYTCSNQAWSLTGVKASLYDISCQYNTTSISALSLAFNGLASAVMGLIDSDDYSGNFAKSVQTAAGVNLNQLGSLESKDGQAYTFDFSKSGGGDIAGAKGTGSGKIVQSQPAPIASYDIDWLRISLDSGKLAQEAYQVYTSNGRPLTTGLACTNGEKDNTPYSAQMWFYVSNANSSLSPTTFANQCSKRIRTTKAKKQMVILANAVQYGVTDKACNSIEDCTKKCLKVKNCVGFSISTEDGEGVTKLQVLDAKLGYAFNFNSGIVRSITNKQYVDRQGGIHACPKGQITASDFLGCVVPPECLQPTS